MWGDQLCKEVYVEQEAENTIAQEVNKKGGRYEAIAPDHPSEDDEAYHDKQN